MQLSYLHCTIIKHNTKIIKVSVSVSVFMIVNYTFSDAKTYTFQDTFSHTVFQCLNLWTIINVAQGLRYCCTRQPHLRFNVKQQSQSRCIQELQVDRG